MHKFLAVVKVGFATLAATVLVAAGAVYAALPLSAIPKVSALFETSLASRISSSATSMTLVTGTDDAGNSLSGVYGFIIDEGTTAEEFVIGTASGTAITGMLRGISVTDATTEVASLKFEHRRGASVKITSFPLLGIVYRILQGTEGFPNKLFYVSHPTFTTDTEIVDKKYVDDITVAGAPDAGDTTKGVVEQATTAEIDAGTGAGSTSARLFVNPEKLSTSIYATRLPGAGEKSALVGTVGTPGSGNKYVTNDDTATTGNGVALRTLSTGKVDPAVTYNSATLTFAETINGSSTPQAVVVGNADTPNIVAASHIVATDAAQDAYDANYFGQTFTLDAYTTRISRLELNFHKVGSPTGSVTIEIRATSGGLPTGAALASKSYTAANMPTLTSTDKFFTVDFATPATVTAGGVYAVVIGGLDGDASNLARVRVKNSDVYAGGQAVSSTDSGSSWSGAAQDWVFRVYGYEAKTAAQVYKADADNANRLTFAGFTKDNVSASATGKVITTGIVPGFTGLTAGVRYYLSDTAGSIATTAGTNRVEVGTAVSTTELLIGTAGSCTGLLASNSTVDQIDASYDIDWPKYYRGNCGFRPRVIEIIRKVQWSTGTVYYSSEVASFENTTFKYGKGFRNQATSVTFDSIQTAAIQDTAASWTVDWTINTIDQYGFELKLNPAATNTGGYLFANIGFIAHR